MDAPSGRIGMKWTVPSWRRAQLCLYAGFALAAALALSVVMLGTSSVAADAAPSLDTTVTNTAAVAGPLDIELEEPAWDGGEDAEENGIPDVAEHAIPGLPIPKDPIASNVSSLDAWVFMTVDIPVADVRISQGAYAELVEGCELFTFVPDDVTWTLLGRYSVHEGAVTYAFAYREIVPPDATTTPLFEHVVMSDIVDGDLSEIRAQDIVVAAHGIQSKGFDNAEDAWSAYAEQTGVVTPLSRQGDAL